MQPPDTDIEELSPTVSKEDRFGADIGRSWPPRQPPSSTSGSGIRSEPAPSSITAGGHDQRPQDVGGKALFNERSNRFEEASSYRGSSGESSSNNRPFPQSQSTPWGRRDPYAESPSGRWQQDRSGTNSTGSVQMLRKTSHSTQEGDLALSPTIRAASPVTNRYASPLSPAESFGSNLHGPGPQSRSRYFFQCVQLVDPY